jgi:putative IMPACT (imprinted ancient) family translation regulator
VSDSYPILDGTARAETPKVKGSRFIGEAFAAPDDASVAACLADVRRREPQATHWCWAARLGAPGERGDGATPRTSDDGEPSGSAGIPILREIERRGLSDTLVVVTRYYGGTKLGTGGLARAYGEAAGLALDAAPTAVRVVRVAIRLAFGFADTAAAMRVASGAEVVVREQTYGADGTVLMLDVPRSAAEGLMARFVEATAGRGIAEVARNAAG